MYPQARILAASRDDLDRDSRRLFQAKCAIGDWDGFRDAQRSSACPCRRTPETYLEARWPRVPKLLQSWQLSADIKTADDLKLPVHAAACPRERRAETAEVVIDPTASSENSCKVLPRVQI